MSEGEITKILAELQKTNQRLIEDHNKRLTGMEKDMVTINLLVGQNSNEIKELKSSQTNATLRIDNNMASIKEDLTEVKLSIAKTSWIPIIMTAVLTAVTASVAVKLIGV